MHRLHPQTSPVTSLVPYLQDFFQKFCFHSQVDIKTALTPEPPSSRSNLEPPPLREMRPLNIHTDRPALQRAPARAGAASLVDPLSSLPVKLSNRDTHQTPISLPLPLGSTGQQQCIIMSPPPPHPPPRFNHLLPWRRAGTHTRHVLPQLTSHLQQTRCATINLSSVVQQVESV